MPQFAIETFFTQYFWLVIIFLLFNDFILHKFIPSMSKIIKARKLTSSYENKNIESININIDLPINIDTSKTWGMSFAGARKNWINNIK